MLSCRELGKRVYPNFRQNARSRQVVQAGTIFNITEYSPCNIFFSHHERINLTLKLSCRTRTAKGTAGKQGEKPCRLEISRSARMTGQMLHLLTEHKGPVDDPAPRLCALAPHHKPHCGELGNPLPHNLQSAWNRRLCHRSCYNHPIIIQNSVI
jgi:hypothetical protein